MANKSLQLILTMKDEASKQLQAFSKHLDTSTASSKKLATGMMAVTTAVSGLGLLAVKEFMVFEKQMSMVKAITGSTGNEFESLTVKAKQLGRTTAFTAKEAGDAMQFLGMAGFDTNEILQSIGPTLDLAAAGQIDLGMAADIATNILTGFRLEASEAGRVMDVMAKTATTSNTNIVEMGEAMKYLAPIAAELKIEVEEASAVVGLLANAGLKGSMATAVLTTSLQSLADPTDEMIGALKNANVQLWDSQGSFVGLIDLVKQFEIGMADMTDQQKLATLTQVFGVRAAKQFSILISNGSETLQEYTKQLQLANGEARRMAETQLDNLAGALTILKSAWSGLLIELGAGISHFFNFGEIINSLTSKLSWLTETFQLLVTPAEKLPDLIKNLGLSSEEAGERIQIANQFISKMKDILPLIAAALAGMLLPALVSVTIAAGAFMLSLAPFAALGVALYLIWQKWGDQIISFLMPAIDNLREWFGSLMVRIEEAGGVVNWLKEIITGILPTINENSLVVQWLSEQWSKLYNIFIENLLPTLLNLWETFKPFIPLLMEIAKVVGTILVVAIGALISITLSIIEKITWLLKIITDVTSWIANKFEPGLTNIANTFQKIVDIVVNLIAKLKELKNAAAGAISNIPVVGGLFGGGRASGGEVKKGTSYLVGENGPELFTPGASGNITPNGGLGRSMSGGGVVINVYGDISGEELISKVKNAITGELNLNGSTI